ncbi:MAG: AIPR family protein [Candidatus Wildermuthbacteria bacterium]|nr:AIPR family protein [Candidatus Wildermuthbacteria bacterium]
MSQSVVIKFPVYSFRKQPTPADEKGKGKYHIVINVADVPAELNEWRALNIRDPKEQIRVPKEIRDSLRDKPSEFYFKNRGLLVIADEIIFDNKSNMVELRFSDPLMNGLADGGHTYRVIRNHIEDLPEDERKEIEAYVSMECLEGFKTREEVVPIIEARNNSTPIQEQSTLELLGSFAKIKDVLKGKSYAPRVFYKQYEESLGDTPKDIDVKEILSYLICFDTEGFDEKTHPIKAYSSRAAVVDYFKENKDRLEKYIPLLPEILVLRDRIYLRLPKVYNKNKKGEDGEKGGKFGKLKGVDKVERGPKEELIFVGEESDFRIPSGFIYPILASFRNLISVEQGKCTWKDDPFKLLDDLEEDLITVVGEQALSLKNPNALGKDAATWRLCYAIVENVVLRRHL